MTNLENMKKLRHYFIPHSETHQKAHLLSWKYLVIYILLFLILRAGFNLATIYEPGVLGVSSNITVSQIIEGTNQERQKLGLPPLVESQALDDAARRKAANMLEENYWAHFSPTGKDPWGFISAAGYKFSYAGENLARNFSNSSDVVTAWMNSPSHRDNIASSKYKDIGIAVVDGTLQGQQTTLVVQMFGTPISYQASAAKPQVDLGGKKVQLPQGEPVPQNPPQAVAGSALKDTTAVIKPAADPFATTKMFGIAIVALLTLLIAADAVILKRRGVFRLSSHPLAHLGFLAIAGASMLFGKVGEIL